MSIEIKEDLEVKTLVDIVVERAKKAGVNRNTKENIRGF